MISKFFIERPVLANVLAILMVVIGAVALFRLPVAQYPNVVPPTISVTTRYPGASARAVVDTVALPIEQQVNGVDGMIYMQSYSAADGSYTLTVTFKIGMDINFAQVLVQNRVSSALAQLPQAVQAQGVTVQQKSTADSAVRHSDLAGRSLRQPFPCQLRDHLAAAGARASAGRRPSQYLRGRPVFDAHLARPRQALRVLADDRGCHQRAQRPEPTGHRRPARHAADAEHASLSNIRSTSRAASTTSASSRTSSSRPTQNGQMIHVRDVGRVELGAQTYSQVFTLNGKPAAGIGIYQTLEANALDVAGEVAPEDEPARARAFRQG